MKQSSGMRIYRTIGGIVVEHGGVGAMLDVGDWDAFVNDDNLFEKVHTLVDSQTLAPIGSLIGNTKLLPPLESQELWAAGVTYLRSKVGRQEESKNAGGGGFYAHVYEAERPELFFKGTARRVVGHGQHVRVRRDSTWNVPEPELTLMITSSGKIVAYTIGNDMSSRSIEGENPLYLPQAKTYDGCASLGPCLYVSVAPLPPDTVIELKVMRGTSTSFHGSVRIDQMKRSFDELVSFLYRECSFPKGSLLMTGTGIVPGSGFSLATGDSIHITIDPIGTLENSVG